jgi:alpha-N-acetylglucosamine transferase
MTDIVEPVAWIDFDSAMFLRTAAYLEARVTSYPDEIKNIPLYTADQVKELTERLEKAEADRDDALYRSLTLAQRATTAEVALAEARELIKALSRAGIMNSDLAVEVHCWLQANKGDA